MQNRSRRLWGQEIDVVRGGLDEGQVVEFVSDLMARYRSLVERQQHYLSLGMLSEKASMEADRMASDIKSRAREEAQMEVAKIVGQANHKAQEMISAARKTAQEVTRNEMENLLDAARRKANVIETEAKQRAQLFLMRASTVIEEDLKSQFSGVYDQLLSVLRELLGEGHDIEAGWKGKLVELWKKERLELGTYEAVPTVLAAEITRSAQQGALLSEAEVEVPQAEVRAKEEEVFFEAASKADMLDLRQQEAASRGAGSAPSRGDVEVLPEEPPRTRIAAEWHAAEAGEVASQRMPEAPPEERAQEQPKVAFVPPESTAELKRESKGAPKGAAAYEGEIEGEVDINLVPPVELSVMSKLYGELQGNPDMRVLRTVGSYEKGTTITVMLEKPTRLVDMLQRIPGVELASGTPARHGILKKALGGQQKDQGKVTIPLRTKP